MEPTVLQDSPNFAVFFGGGGLSLSGTKVLQTEVAIASEVSNSSTNSLATADLLAKKAQLANYCGGKLAQLQSQNEEIINLTQKRLKRDSKETLPLLHERIQK